MSEELLQRGLDKNNPTSKIGKWDYYNIGATTLKALKGASIIRNLDYGKLETKKVDALIVNRKNVIAVIEFKQPKEFKTKAQKSKAIKQEIEVAHKLGAKITIATDTIDTVWVNTLTGKEICDENGNVIKEDFDPSNEKIVKLIEKINYSLNEKNNNILPKKLVNPTDLARSIWQDVWSVSGATPENCLYTFVELFIFKYLSDLDILRSIDSFDFLMELRNDRTDDEILQYYADNIRKKIKDLFPYNALDNTTIINGTIFVSKDQKAVSGYSTVFMKVLKKFKDYGRLEHIDYDFKSQLFESFLKESISKKNWGQFFTPIKVIRAIEKIAKDEIKEGAKICDPACGVGKFLLEPIKSRLDQFYAVKGDTVIPKITIRGFDKGFDKDEQKTIILAKANMLIYFSEIIKDYPNHTVEFGKIFNDSFTLKTNSILGTLRDPIKDEYDLILTNPPYVTSGSSNLKDEIKKDEELKKYYKVNAIGVEGLFMEWIIRALKPNGKAFIVVPDGIFNRQNDKNLRAFIKETCFIDGIISLPLNTFFTTNKKTYILCLTKKNDKAYIQTDPVFTYLASEIGESRDVNRFNIEQNDLDEAVTLYNFFKGNKSNFKNFNKDPRCKIFDIDMFDPDGHWSIDRWWSREDKIELGIEEENKTIDIQDFSSLVSDISETIGGFSEMIKEVAEKKNSLTSSQDIYLSDTNYFKLFIGKRVTKKELQNIKDGTIPVYSANVFIPMGFHTTSNIEDFNFNKVIWGIDGNFEFNTIKTGVPFRTTDHCGTLQILHDDILPEYLMSELENIKHVYGFDRELRASLKNMQKIKVSIPLLENGGFDVEHQKNVIKKYNVIQDLKRKIKEYKREIKIIKVNMDSSLETCKAIRVSELFETEKGLSKYTKNYGENNKGQYPVYSASNNAPLTYIDTYDYDGKYLTWATNGFAGYIKVLDEKFSANGDRGILIPKVDNIDIDYVRFTLEPSLRELAKGRKGDKGSNEFTKVYPSMVESVAMSIPVLENGNLDLITQQEAARKYQKIEQIKKLIEEELFKIETLVVEY
ncbi:MAG: Type I restriction-modification system methyltransferase subunit [uncultured Sulfurovum sp.]|uniref:site-specific DNA-methyltransferase (adenine-specific) n=1 Tax=uncultured Sulfurovum sp. TaxID=269237 RepID=A0A6S6T0S4_9BACT|nr:MAG: Type I restriction-modification system methyltransferase subunit [uncultured Sulfurovum sp.]